MLAARPADVRKRTGGVRCNEGLGDAPLLPTKDLLVLAMRPDPEPDEIAVPLDRESTIVRAYSGGPKSRDLLEAE